MSIDNIFKKYFFLLLLFNFSNADAQPRTLSYSKAWIDVYKTIENSFATSINDSSKVFEQTAIIQLEIKNGKIDTFTIWSPNINENSKWLTQFFSPLIKKYYEGFLPYKFVLIPVRVYDTRNDDRIPIIGEDFIFSFVSAFKHQARGNIVITPGIVLSTPWISNKNQKR
jgi:hypothetical protein